MLGSGCPASPPHCPNCEIKTARFVVDDYDELAEGYTIASATMTVSMEFEQWCPNEDEKPPCTYEDQTSLSQVDGPGKYEQALPIESEGGETVTITIVLRNGAEEITKTVIPTIVSTGGR
ncbi:MAG: hypothetical protein AB1Z98_31030 [Nannocystaceae bacterium]